jgi:ABC-2 type transport system permease protein
MFNPRQLVVILKREYIQRVRTRSFVVMTVVIPVLMVGYVLFLMAMNRVGASNTANIAVIDLSGKVAAQLAPELKRPLQNGRPQFKADFVAATPITLAAAETALRRRVASGNLDGFLIIPADVLQSNVAVYHSKNAAALAQQQWLETDLAGVVNRVRLEQAGIPPSQLDRYQSHFDLKIFKLTGSGAEREDSGQTFMAALAMTMLLYIALLQYGTAIMRSVVQEKVNRVAELMLAATDPFTMMLGKIVGVGAAGLTQLAIWTVCLAAIAFYAGAMAGRLTFQVPAIVWIFFVIYFLLGFLVYAGLYAAIGAIVTNEQESQQTQLPVTLLIVVGFIVAITVLQDPANHLALIFSEVPLFTPVVMIARMAVSSPPVWQIALSIVLCLITIAVLARLAAKVYRVGILMTGKRATLPELVRWLRQA